MMSLHTINTRLFNDSPKSRYAAVCLGWQKSEPRDYLE